MPKISSAHNNSHQKSSKSEAETQGRPDDEHSDFTGNQHEKIIGYNMASVPGAKPQHMQIKSESLTSPARCQTALEEPQVHPASQHEVKPTVSAIPLHQPATKPRPGATSPNSLKVSGSTVIKIDSVFICSFEFSESRLSRVR